MSKVIVFINLTLDGVMQAPARPDEDRRGGFEHGTRTTDNGIVIVTYQPASPTM